MNVNDAVARILKTEGVEWISCFPSNNLIESVAAEGIRTVLFRQERGALMAADGYSRMNDRRKFGVAITQGGPGSENSLMAESPRPSPTTSRSFICAGGPALGQYAVRPNFSPVRSYQSVSKHSRGHHRAGPGGSGPCARAFTQSAQRSRRSGDRGNPRRRGWTGSAGGVPELPATQAAAAVPIPRRCYGCGAAAAERPASP